MLTFPELKQPTVLDPLKCRLVIESYQRWMAHAFEHFGIKAREFNGFNEALNGLHHLPYTTRWLTMIGPTSPLTNLNSSLRTMGMRAPDFAPIKELEGDLAMLVAETAEPSIRAIKKSGSAQSHAGAAAAMILGPLAKISTLEKVRELYAFASVVYAECTTLIFKMMESTAPNDPHRTQYVIADQLMVKYLGAVGRTLLMDLDLWLEEHENDVDIPVASAREVLTLVARYPEARTVLRDKVLEFPFRIIAHGSVYEFNNDALAIGFFTNAAIIAAVVGDFSAARRACGIAGSFAGGEPPPQLQAFSKLVETLDPQAKA